MIIRDRYLKLLQIRRNNGLIKVITGLRRSGKSYLMNEIFYNDLLKSGIKEEQIIKFAFDSYDDLLKIGEKLEDIEKDNRKVDASKFIKYISSKIGKGTNYIFLLDEVQKLSSFESVLNSYLKMKNIDIYVTGSNSKFLSSDIVTEFRGRGDVIHVLPLSFSEFYAYYKGNKEYALDDYINYGGLPDVSLMKDDEQKINYLDKQLKTVYLADIKNRHNLNENSDIDDLLNVVSSNISSLLNPLKLENTFKTNKKSNLNHVTIDKYISYMEDAFMLKKSFRYDIKGKKYINSPYKIYFEDLGIRNASISFRQRDDYPMMMENIIYNELRYRGYNVDVGVVETREYNKNNSSIRKQLEVDFVANLGSKRYYIQSACAIPSAEKMNQELKSFNNLNDSFKKIIVVEKSMKPKRNEKGYLMIGLKEFLLNIDSLEF